MTARKNSTESTKDSQVADPSKDVQTTKEAEEKEENLPTSAEQVKDADENPAAPVTPEEAEDRTDEFEDAFPVDGDSLPDGAVGVTVEEDRDGNEYEAPYALLTAADLARTSDSDDEAKSWTAQEASGEREDEDGSTDPVALVPVEGTPGQTFRVRELPDREVAEAAGIDYDQWVAGLPVRADVPDEGHRRGIPA